MLFILFAVVLCYFYVEPKEIAEFDLVLVKNGVVVRVNNDIEEMSWQQIRRCELATAKLIQYSATKSKKSSNGYPLVIANITSDDTVSCKDFFLVIIQDKMSIFTYKESAI